MVRPGYQRLQLGVEPRFEVNTAGSGYLIISWLLVLSSPSCFSALFIFDLLHLNLLVSAMKKD
jgi:hypothetical protein